jgi:hypothetical protein
MIASRSAGLAAAERINSEKDPSVRPFLDSIDTSAVDCCVTVTHSVVRFDHCFP